MNGDKREDFMIETCVLSYGFFVELFKSYCSVPKHIKVYVRAPLCTNIQCSSSAHTVVHLEVLKYLYHKIGHVQCATYIYLETMITVRIWVIIHNVSTIIYNSNSKTFSSSYRSIKAKSDNLWNVIPWGYEMS